jgi:hypothetical protein
MQIMQISNPYFLQPFGKIFFNGTNSLLLQAQSQHKGLVIKESFMVQGPSFSTERGDLFFLELLKLFLALLGTKIVGLTTGFIFETLVLRDIGAADRVFLHLLQDFRTGGFIGFPLEIKEREPLSFPQHLIENIADTRQQEQSNKKIGHTTVPRFEASL